MSKKKHNISYVKPDEPKFLRELKKQIGYKEGPTVDTKREILPEVFDEEKKDELIDEKPIVVVLNSGDLTAEEADTFRKQKEEEESNAPADLTKRIVFRKTRPAEAEPDVANRLARKRAKRAKQPQKIVLSFDANNIDDDNDNAG